MQLPSPNFRSPLQGSAMVDTTLPRAMPWADIDDTVGVARHNETINPKGTISPCPNGANYANLGQRPRTCDSTLPASPNGANYVNLGQRPRYKHSSIFIALKGRPNLRPNTSSHPNQNPTTPCRNPSPKTPSDRTCAPITNPYKPSES